MMPSQYVPVSVSAETREQLTKKMLVIQAREGGKVSIINICQDLKTKEWVCWYLPLVNLGGGLF
jgi:hypothetical protein